MAINLQNILEGLTQLNPQAAQQLAQRKSAAETLKARLFEQNRETAADTRSAAYLKNAQDSEARQSRIDDENRTAQAQARDRQSALDAENKSNNDWQRSMQIGQGVNAGTIRQMAPAGPDVGGPTLTGLPTTQYTPQGWDTDQPMKESGAVVPPPTSVTPGPMGATPTQAPSLDELPGFTMGRTAPSAGAMPTATPTILPIGPTFGNPKGDPTERYRFATQPELAQQKSNDTIAVARAQEQARQQIATENLNKTIKANPNLSAQTRTALSISAITGAPPPKEAGTEEELMQIMKDNPVESEQYKTAEQKLNDITDALTKAKDNANGGTWSLQQSKDGSWVYFNNKTTETRPASIQKTSAAVESRRAQAKVIDVESDKLIADINAHRDKMGKLSSYWNQYKNNTPISDPVTSGVMAHLASYAALQPALHGFRGQQALAEFERIIGGVPKNPDSLIAAIRSIQGLSKTVQNPNVDDTAIAKFDHPNGYAQKADTDEFGKFGGVAHSNQ